MILSGILFFFLSCIRVKAENVSVFFNEFQDKPVSVCIYSLDEKKDLFSFCQNQLLIPNSIIKIVTSALSVDFLGEDFSFETQVSISGTTVDNILKGNLVIIGDGDPSLGSKRIGGQDVFFEYIYKSLKSQKIEVIEGDLIFNDSAFDKQDTHSTWLASDIANYYGCGVHGFNFMENSFEITFKLGKKGELAQIETIYPLIPQIEIENEVITGDDNLGDLSCIYRKTSKEKLIIKGSLGSIKNKMTIKGAIPFPDKVCYSYLKDYLEKKDIKILAKPFTFNNLKHIGAYKSPLLKDLLILMNQSSINLYAEALNKKISQKKYGLGSFKKSQEIYQEAFDKLGIKGFSIVDGSGLSECNRCSSKAMVSFLSKAWESSNKKILDQVLPKTTLEDGSNLRKWFPEPKYQDLIQAKTGSSSKGKSVAGFLKNKSGKIYCFCAIENLQDPELSKLFRNRFKQALDFITLR